MERKYYIPGTDEIHELVETPMSRERTENRRFVITTVICVVSAVAAVVAAIASIISIFV